MWIVGVLFRKCWEWTSMSPNQVHQWQHHWLLGRQSPNMCYFSRSRLIGTLYHFSMFLSPHFVGVCLFAEKQNSGWVFNNNGHKFSICLPVRWFWAPTRLAWCFDLWKTFIAGEPVPTNKDSTRVSEAFWVHGCKCMGPITGNFVAPNFVLRHELCADFWSWIFLCLHLCHLWAGMFLVDRCCSIAFVYIWVNFRHNKKAKENCVLSFDSTCGCTCRSLWRISLIWTLMIKQLFLSTWERW
jgi:hypothetical protein